MTDILQIDPAKKARIEELSALLNRASEAYYGGKEELISNYEWDSFFDELSALEHETGYILENSPTHTVGSEYSASGAAKAATAGEGLPSDEAESNRREAHEFPALSLAKTKSIAELRAWAGERPVYLSYKLDGLTLVLTYDNGALSRIVTRGNGSVGTNITHLRDVLSGFPQSISEQGHLVVRGEATISYTDFELINALIDDEGERYANPRNLASGTLALDDPQKVKERHVTFHAFTLVYTKRELPLWGDRMAFLQKEGFSVVEYARCMGDELADEIERFTKKVEDGRMDLPVDGLVLCYEDTVYAASGSVTGHHATRAGLAFKWADVSAFSELKYIEWSCAASTISPVAVFEPVSLEGTTVSRASLCNISEMERLGIGDHCTLEIIKANKIIPKCISVKQSSGSFTVPDRCPVCGAAARVQISEKSKTKTLHCENPDCAAKQGKKFTRFVSKSGMDIDGLSIQTMIRFMNERLIRSFSDIYHLSEHAEQIRQLDGFGEKSVENMLNAIERSRSVPAARFLYALCIPMIGLDAAKKLVGALSFDGFLKRLSEHGDFADIDGIGPEKSGQILLWHNEKNAAELSRLLLEVTITDGEAKTAGGGRCRGVTFVITGDVHHYKNRDEFKAYVEAEGGKVAGSVSGKTAFLINNDTESLSSKNRKAKELGIPILSEEEFLERFT